MVLYEIYMEIFQCGKQGPITIYNYTNDIPVYIK